MNSSETSARAGITSTALFASLPSRITTVLEIIDEDIAAMAIDEMNGDVLKWSERHWIDLHIARHLGKISRCLEKAHSGENRANEGQNG